MVFRDIICNDIYDTNDYTIYIFGVVKVTHQVNMRQTFEHLY